jgi:hypothetical protein
VAIAGTIVLRDIDDPQRRLDLTKSISRRHRRRRRTLRSSRAATPPNSPPRTSPTPVQDENISPIVVATTPPKARHLDLHLFEPIWRRRVFFGYRWWRDLAFRRR